MAHERTQIGTKDDGMPVFHYDYKGRPDDVEGNTGGLLLTGPISGTVTLSDGTVYDVTPEVIEHAAGHAGPIAHHIDKMHEANGGIPVGPNMIRVTTHADGTPWKHTCTDACGAEASDTAN